MKSEEKHRWDRVKEGVVATYLRKFELDEGGDLKARCERLQEHFLSQQGERLTCQIKTGGCGFRTPASIPECAFCGDKETDPTIAVATSPVTAEKLVKTEKNKVKPKKSQPEPAQAAESPPVDAGAESGLAKPEQRAISEPERELDEACARVNEIRKRELENYWDLGRELLDIYDRKLYEQRRDPATGAPLYKSFGQFLAREFGFSDVHCFRMMDVAREFSRELAIELGVKKAHLLHSARIAIDAPVKTEKQRAAAAAEFAKFVERAKTESFTELEKDLLPIIKAAPMLDHGRRGHGGRPKGQSKPEAPAVSERERVTCAYELGKRSIPLYVHGQKGKRAKRFQDGPHGAEQLVNGVLVGYEVVYDAEGFLAIDVTVRRAS
jgi:hypothetical protein